MSINLSPSAAAMIPTPKPATPEWGGLNRLTTAALLGRIRPLTPLEVLEPYSLRTERLLLRTLRPTDRDEFIRAVRVSRARLDVHCPLHREGESDDGVFERHLELSDRAAGTGRAWRQVGVDHAGQIVGAFNINDIRRGGLEACGELTFWVSSDAAGRGLCREGLRATIEHALAEHRGLGLHALYALISPDNTASVRAVRSAGLRPEPARAGVELVLRGRQHLHEVWAVRAVERTGGGEAGEGEARGQRAATLSDLTPPERSALLGLLGIEDGQVPFTGAA
jgi:RimJ/RimL family protein N-acetyltransferase